MKRDEPPNLRTSPSFWAAVAIGGLIWACLIYGAVHLLVKYW